MSDLVACAEMEAATWVYLYVSQETLTDGSDSLSDMSGCQELGRQVHDNATALFSVARHGILDCTESSRLPVPERTDKCKKKTTACQQSVHIWTR